MVLTNFFKKIPSQNNKNGEKKKREEKIGSFLSPFSKKTTSIHWLDELLICSSI
jgi:hypothetical protein